MASSANSPLLVMIAGVTRDKIIARYQRVMALLPSAIEVADRVLVYDNSDDSAEARLVISLNRGQVKYRSVDMPQWLTL